ncbi:MAG: hypothetical protein SFY69_13145 [Planctomycetota bacterium]|nr:hypothetical protein [Planctomycetota bacterium]
MNTTRVAKQELLDFGRKSGERNKARTAVGLSLFAAGMALFIVNRPVIRYRAVPPPPAPTLGSLAGLVMIARIAMVAIPWVAQVLGMRFAGHEVGEAMRIRRERGPGRR